MSLEGKTAIVTGSATGIGQGVALALAQAGAKVMVTYNRDPADGTMALIKDAGGTAELVQVDMRDRQSIKNLCAQTHKAFGRIDILVNNAAVQLNKLLFDYSEEEFDWLMGVNVKGYLRCIQEVTPYMKQNNFGRIINVASIHAKRPTGFDAVYGTTKGGVKMLTREAALALGGYGITVNTLSPGSTTVAPRENKAVLTISATVQNLSFNNLPPSGFLSGRVGTPADMGYYVVFLADERSQFITGASIRADGGVMMY
ncbi:MAG: SDR family oxidoreductase [Treponema sp.]|jgi:glucose 1-dehydrogenase|nr:SDR family oxidoreductase [Treponema sp.]